MSHMGGKLVNSELHCYAAVKNERGGGRGAGRQECNVVVVSPGSGVGWGGGWLTSLSLTFSSVKRCQFHGGFVGFQWKRPGRVLGLVK